MESPAAPPAAAGGGAAAEALRAADWAATPLGPLAGWPRALRAAVDVAMGSRFPTCVVWGPALVHVYNDAFVPVLGRKHPAAMGAPASEAWAEIWPLAGPALRRVLATGASGGAEDRRLLIDRRGFLEEAYFTFSYGPVHGDGGAVEGVFVTALETTAHVVSRRRHRTLRRAEAAAAGEDGP
ncbi:MAG TPA: hypothetical protein VHG91_01990, partial [Longimicrobium sp.]|nr:hypothetical protein [Longimicrobium sp.]